MRSKKSNRKRLEEELSSLWSQCVRARDKSCVLCGNTSSLQAHHWIATRNQSSKYKYDLRNGVTLCYGCHIHQVHCNPSEITLQRLKNRCISLGIAKEGDINEIQSCYHEITKHSIGELENIKTALKAYLEGINEA